METDTLIEKKLWARVYDTQLRAQHQAMTAATNADKAVKEFRKRADATNGTLWATHAERTAFETGDDQKVYDTGYQVGYDDARQAFDDSGESR
jgi:hypothetical protein